jgi:hypothetical protein
MNFFEYLKLKNRKDNAFGDFERMKIYHLTHRHSFLGLLELTFLLH